MEEKYNSAFKDKGNKTKKGDAKKFKGQYFDFYDDVKSHTHDVVDW